MRSEDLIQRLKGDIRVLRTPRIEEAFRAVDRKFFVPKELQDEAYEDYPLPIGYGATISQPTTVVFLLEQLDVREGQKVLDIGSGSGWTAALLAHLVVSKGTPPHQLSRHCPREPTNNAQNYSAPSSPRPHMQSEPSGNVQRESWCGGKVIGLEIVPALVELGRQNLARHYSHILKNMRIVVTPIPEIRQAKRGKVGLPEEGPYDRILVSAAAKEIPKELIEQLKPDGVMVIPVGGRYEIQKILRIRKKSEGKIETEEYPGFVFVPLLH